MTWFDQYPFTWYLRVNTIANETNQRVRRACVFEKKLNNLQFPHFICLDSAIFDSFKIYLQIVMEQNDIFSASDPTICLITLFRCQLLFWKKSFVSLRIIRRWTAIKPIIIFPACPIVFGSGGGSTGVCGVVLKKDMRHSYTKQDFC